MKFKLILASVKPEKSDPIVDAAKAAGATGWIVKPFKPTQLLTLIEKIVPDN